MSIPKNAVYIIFRTILGSCIAILISLFPFYFLESSLYDLRFSLNPIKQKSDAIVTISIDENTIQNLKRQPTIKDHSLLLKTLLKENPVAIYYTVDPNKLVGTPQEKREFSRLIKQFRNHIIYTESLPTKGEEDKLLLGNNFDGLKYSPGALSYDYKHFAEDGVARRAVLKFDGYVFSQVIAANLINPINDIQDYRGSFEFLGSQQINVNYQPTGTFVSQSFKDVIDGRYLRQTFKDRIVLIGTDIPQDHLDFLKSVYDRRNFAISKLEAHANIISTLILNNGIIKTPSWFNFIITLSFSLIVTFAVFGLKPARALYVILSVASGYCILSWILFSFLGIATGLAQPLLTIFVCYYFFIPYRLIQENRRFWELTQKNKLLTQVEELKNNFLSMMSHDLKTPLARIQGMADVALQKGGLAPEQKNAVTSIKRSAEELTEFISSILDLSRVESQQIKLHLQSKDVNQILEDTIKKYDYLAKEKQIEVVREFEPLFSVKLDPDLMRQVFGNLVENAIKYSPENSKILVSTEEAQGQIIVQIADQGIGISENEIKNIFTKFYRTKDVKNSPIKGSGLGLYLAKYFIELHNGEISVESLPNEGSTFTVQLPMDL